MGNTALKQIAQRVGEFGRNPKVKKYAIIGGSTVIFIIATVAIVKKLKPKLRVKKILNAFSKWVGVKEIGNNQGWDNKDFEAKMRAIGFYDGAQWCNFFVKMVILSLCKKDSKGYKFWNTNLNPATQVTWANLNGKKSEYYTQLTKPEPGAIVIYRSNDDASKGHIEIVKTVNADGSYSVISGNSPLTGGGEGVALRNRTKDGYGGVKILGFFRINKF